MTEHDIYLDRLVLVGLTWVDRTGTVVHQSQLHGRITAVSESDGILIAVAPDGHPFRLPPHLPSLSPAPPGKYREYSTGTEIVDPDYLSMWEIHEPTDPASPGDWRPGPSISWPPSEPEA